MSATKAVMASRKTRRVFMKQSFGSLLHRHRGRRNEWDGLRGRCRCRTGGLPAFAFKHAALRDRVIGVELEGLLIVGNRLRTLLRSLIGDPQCRDHLHIVWRQRNRPAQMGNRVLRLLDINER